MSQLMNFYNSFQTGNKAGQNAPQPEENTAPTFEDLSIDDGLSELQRLTRYTKSNIGLQRLVHVKMIGDVAVSVGFEDTFELIIPLLEDLSLDSEPAIKQQLAGQLAKLASLCVKEENGERGYKTVLEAILPLTARLLEDEKSEVRQAAANTLVGISEVLKPDDLGQHVLTIILQLAHDDDKEEMRMTAAQLLNMLAECLGQDLCKQFVIPEVVSLSEDPVFRVRKSTALNFHNICRVGGDEELFERLMPAFVRLSKDDMYRVRRACAESIFAIAEHVSDDIRVGVLVEIFLRLSQDPARLVKQSALQQSGVFIATLPSRAVSDAVMQHYHSMASEPIGDLMVDAELKHYCAYSFPAVLATIGAARWPEVRTLFHTLVQSRSAHVRQTLASSLHEVARLLGGGKIVEEELVPVFEELIQDIEVVQIGVMKNLAKFLIMLSEPCRISYLPEMHNILHVTNPFNWRLRQCLALQLPVLLDLPPVGSIYITLFPLIMTLLQDPVASVRKESFRGVQKLVQIMHALANGEEPGGPNDKDKDKEKDEEKDDVEVRKVHKQHFNSVIRSLNSLVLGETCQPRQLWAELCVVMLKNLPRALFEEHFIDGLLLLTTDRVCNVRTSVAAALTGWAPDWTDAGEYVGPAEVTGEPNLLAVVKEHVYAHQDAPVPILHKNASKKAQAELEALELEKAAAAVKDAQQTEAEVDPEVDPDPVDVDVEDKDKNGNASSSPPTSPRTVESRILPHRHVECPWNWLLERKDIQECVSRLREDDQSVYERMRLLEGKFPNLQFKGVSVRGLKSPPGGAADIANSVTGAVGAAVFRKTYGNLDEERLSVSASEIESVSSRKSSISDSSGGGIGSGGSHRPANLSSLALNNDVSIAIEGDSSSSGGVFEPLVSTVSRGGGARPSSPGLEDSVDMDSLQPVQTEEVSKNTKLEAQEENDLTPNFLPVKDKEEEL